MCCVLCIGMCYNVLPVNLGGWPIIMKKEGLVMKREFVRFEREVGEWVWLA